MEGFPEGWPPMRGDFTLGEPRSRVAVVTLASRMRVEGAAISGPCKTENLGVEKVVANIISNPDIRFLVICGPESRGHLPGDAIKALHKNGTDEKGRIVGAKGAIPFIENLPPDAVARFRDQVEVLDSIGLEDVGEVASIVREYANRGEAFSAEPIFVFRRRRASALRESSGGDVVLGDDIALDSSAWIVTAG